MKYQVYKITFFLLFLLSTTYGFGQTCSVPQSERDALMALYNATNGPNWDNNTNWNTAADVCDWYGVTVTNGVVTGLGLGDNQLSGSIPTDIGNLTNLTQLNLEWNQITGSIPTGIGNLSNLTYLNLVANQLTGVIPSELGNMLNLTFLSLQTNQLSGAIPFQIGNLTNLAYLNLQNNELSGAIPFQIGNLTNLTKLHLESNQLTGNIPSELGNLSGLWVLDLRNNQLTGNIPLELGNLSSLQMLHLQNNQLTGSIPAEIGNLINLTDLRLEWNQITGSIPTEIGNLTNLNSLFLSNNQLSGTIPSEIGNLNSLIWLYLSSNQLQGAIPDFTNSVNLNNLYFTNNRFIFSDFENEHSIYTGYSTYTYSPQAKVDAVEAPTVIEGTSYTFTTSLSSPNNSYQWYKDGVIISGATSKDYTIAAVAPSDAGTYYVKATNSTVTGLTLQRNNITLSVASCGVSAIERQALIDLYNATNGANWNDSTNWNTAVPVCGWHGVTVENESVTGLDLTSNMLSGTIPASIGNLSNLKALLFFGNNLTGTIPPELGNTSLERIHLGNNQLTGAIPVELTSLTNLYELFLEANQLSGDIPDFTNLTNLDRFLFAINKFVFRDFETEHGTYLANLSSYAYDLQAKVDAVETPTVTEGASYTFTTSLSSPNNSYQWYKDGIAISGATSKDYTINPVSLTDAGVYYVVATNSVVTGLTLQRNDITLTVTPNTCGVPQSERDALMAFYNATNGPNWTNTLANTQAWDINIPVCDWYGVTVTNGVVTGLSLGDNQLSGSIPTEIGSLTNLTHLNFELNQITGPIPIEIGNLSNLAILNLSDNQLTGSIPTEIGSLTNLTHLNFELNQITGSIPMEIGNLSNLANLNLSDNQLTGSIPTEIGSLTSLTHLNLEINRITGSIPMEIGNLTNLTYLDLESNQITGSIPTEIGNLTNLAYLQLYENQLTGSIPTEIGNLTNLYHLDLAYNKLTGTIPAEIGNLTNLVILIFHENNFIFSDFENEHNTYTTNLTTYVYSPQAKVDQEETINLTEGNSITLTSNQLTSLNNSYQWYKDGIPITNATSKDYVIANASLSDAGVYHFTATNSFVTGLTLQRNDITITVTASTLNVCLSGVSGKSDYSSDNNVRNNLTLSMLDNSEISVINASITKGINYSDQEVLLNINFDEFGSISFSDKAAKSNTIYKAFEIIYYIETSSGIYQGTEIFYAESINDGRPYDGALVASFQCPDIPIENDNTFCTSDIEVITVENLTPNGSNILWYASETDTTPISSDFDLTEETELGGVVYWWDDTSDGNTTRTPVTVYIDEGTPEGEEYQEFTISENATVASLQAIGTNINWYSTANGGTPLDINTPLVDGDFYYAEDAGVSSCRLFVEVFVGTFPPEGDGVQFVCPGSTITDLVLETLPSTSTVNWYTSEIGGAPIAEPESTFLEDDTTYYVSHVDGADESEERKSIKVLFYNVNPPVLPYSTQKFYSDEAHTIANLLAIGNNIQWYSQQGILYASGDALQDGVYYAQQTTNEGCISERVSVTVDILDEPLPTIISCEKFKPQLGGQYVISGWVREQGVTFDPNEAITINFSEVSSLFVDLLNHLKDRLLSSNSNRLEFDIPSDVYIPKSDDEIVNFDALVPYVVDLQAGENKLKIYNFKRIKDDYGRAIGFQFSLRPPNQENELVPVFRYETPKVRVSSCNTCLDPEFIEINHPLLGRGPDILNFTNAQFNNGILSVSQSFTPADGVTVVVQNPVTEVEAASPIVSETITYNDFKEDPTYQSPHYGNPQIEITYIGKEGIDLTNEVKRFSTQGAIIDGWQQIIGVFTIHKDAKLLNINLKNSSPTSNVNVYFDDIRIHPFDSNMKTFVYHPETQRLMSELDENNYATFYEYDLEGGLVRVKKETEKGIYTIQETRSGNVKATN